MKVSSVLATFVVAISSLSFTNFAQATTLTNNPILTQSEVEKRVREYFSDAPAMIEIARCESKFRQYTDDGSVLRGGAGGGMVGVFQFYESIHDKAAKALGFDLTTLEGNLGYAKHVYLTEGTNPWNSAKYCWENTTYSNAAASILTVTDTARREQLLKQIDTLTKLITLLKKQLQAKEI